MADLENLISDIVGVDFEAPINPKTAVLFGAVRIVEIGTGKVTAPTVHTSAIGKAIALVWISDMVDRLTSPSEEAAIEGTLKRFGQEIGQDVETAVSDCMIEGQEIPGRGSKVASEVIEEWNGHGEEWQTRIDAILNTRGLTLSPVGNLTQKLFNKFIVMWVKCFALMINCVEGQIEPSIVCFDKEKCKNRIRIPAIVDVCVETESTG